MTETHWLKTPEGRRAHQDPSCSHLVGDTLERISETERQRFRILTCCDCSGRSPLPSP